MWMLSDLGNKFNKYKFKTIISSAIKEREEFILKKKSMKIEADQRIVDALNTSSMPSSN